MFNSIKSLFARKSSETSETVYLGGRDAKWMSRDYKAFSEEGYQRNVVAYQAINKTADAVASIPYYVKAANGDDVTDSPLVRLLQKPNLLQTYDDLMRNITAYYRIAGNSYIEKTMFGNRPRELYSIRPDRTCVVPSDHGVPRAYMYRVGNSRPVVWDVDPTTGASDILHIKTFNPLDDWYGMSPIEGGAYAIDQHNEAMKWIQSLLQNGASPSGALEIQTRLKDDDRNNLRDEIAQIYSGSRNAGRPMLLEGGMKWTAMGLSPQQMSIIEQKNSSARDVSLALGVPPLLLNIPGDNTYANYKEARLAFYEETVIPLASNIIASLNEWLSPYFEGQTICLDLEQIPAIAEKRMMLWDMADKSTDLTINERREMKGYEPAAGGDNIMVGISQVPLAMAVDPDLGNDDDNDIGLTAEELRAIAYAPEKQG